MAEKVVGFKITLSGTEKTFENISSLKDEIKKVNDELSKATKGSEEYDKLSQEAAVLKTELNGVNKELKDQQKAFEATKFAAGSYKALNAELGQLKNAYKELSSEEIKNGKITDENVKKYGLASNSVESLQKKINGLSNELKAQDKGLGDSQRNVGNYASAFEGFGGAIGKVAGSLGGGFAIFAGVEAIGAIAQEIKATTDEIFKLQGQIQSLNPNLPTAEVDEFAARITAISSTFEKENTEVLQAANSFSKQFGVSLTEATDLIEKGLVGGLDANGDFLDILKEYPVQFKQAGFSADAFLSVINKTIDQGVFSDKGIDLVKEFSLRIQEGSQGAKDSLSNAFGPQFTDKLFKGINDGSITVQDALAQVSTKLNDTQLPASELQSVISNVFGAQGEDVGIDFIKSLKDINSTTGELIDTDNRYQQQQLAILEANKGLAQSQVELTNLVSGGSSKFQELGIILQKFVYDLIIRIIEIFTPLVTAFQNAGRAVGELIGSLGIFNNEGGESFSVIDLITGSMKVFADVLTFVVDGITWLIDGLVWLGKEVPAVGAAFEFIGDVIGGIFEFFTNLPSVFAGVVSAIKQLGTNFSNFFQDLYLQAKIFGQNVKGAFGADVEAAINDLKAQRAALKDASKSIGQAYSDGYSESIKQIEAVRKADKEAQKKANKESVKDTKDAESERTKILQKSAEDRKKLAEDAKKAAENIEQLKLELIDNEFDREIAKLTKASVDKIKALAGSAEQVKQQTALINTLLDQQIAGVEKKRQESIDKQKEQVAKASQEVAKLIADQQLKTNDALFKADQGEGQRLVQRIDFEIQINEQQLQLDIAQQKQLLLEQLNSREISVREYNQKTEELEAEASERTLEILKQRLEQEKMSTIVANSNKIAQLQFNISQQKSILEQQAIEQDAKLKAQLDNGLITEEQYEAARVAIRQNANAQIALLDQQFTDEQSIMMEETAISSIEAQQRLADQQIAIDAQKNETLRAQNAQTSKFIGDTIGLSLDFIGTLVSGTKELLEQDEENREKNQKRIKNLALAEVAINLAKELALIAISAQQAGLATGPAAPITAGIVYGIQAGIAIARAAFAIAKIKNESKAEEGIAIGANGVDSSGSFGNANIPVNGFISGNLHSQGGERGVFNGMPIEAERGEYVMRNGKEFYIINRKSSAKFGATLRKNSVRSHKFSPEKRAMASAVNSYRDWGVKFAAGGALSTSPLAAPTISSVTRETQPLLDKFDRITALLTTSILSTQENIAAVQENVNTLVVVNDPEETADQATKIKSTKRVNNLTL
jgi:hypothetical protein